MPTKSAKTRRVPRGPALELDQIAVRPPQPLPPPLNRATGVRFYGYARMGLYEGIHALWMRPGDNVLLPAFLCNSVLAPFHARGIEMRFYDVDAGLCPDLDSAARLLDLRTRAILVVHYFGFPQDSAALRAFCRAHGLAYIEDNAHGFLSAQDSRPLGTFGDIAVFSFRKTISVPHGAALVLNRGDIPPPRRRRGPLLPARDLLRFALRDGVRHLEMLAGLDLVSRVRGDPGAMDADAEPDEEHTPVAHYRVGYSALADAIARRTPLDRHRQVRRATYQHWLDRADDLKGLGGAPIFPALAPGVVPYAFPLRARDPQRLIAALAREGVSCSTWPALPRQVRAEGRERPVVLIPVHRHPLAGDIR